MYISIFIALLFIGIYVSLMISALISIRTAKIKKVLRFLWVLLIICLPIMGSVAFFIVKPDEQEVL